MDNPYRRLPPLGALIGFEAAARLGSFSRAADELNMTQSAISHQIRTLEQHLGQPLFLRLNRRVELTDAGHDLRRTAEDALETVRHGVQRLGAFSKPGSVVLHMPPELGALWFVPRLPTFRAAHPGIDPWLFTTDRRFDLTEAEVDVTLTRSAMVGEGVVRRALFTDRRMPMAAPGLAGGVQVAPLLHDENAQGWQAWFDRAGLTRDDMLKGPNFSDPAMMLEAATQGMGLCLGSEALAAPYLADGRLQVVSDVALPDASPLWIVTLERNLTRTSVRALWEWLVDQAPG